MKEKQKEKNCLNKLLNHDVIATTYCTTAEMQWKILENRREA